MENKKQNATCTFCKAQLPHDHDPSAVVGNAGVCPVCLHVGEYDRNLNLNEVGKKLFLRLSADEKARLNLLNRQTELLSKHVSVS